MKTSGESKFTIELSEIECQIFSEFLEDIEEKPIMIEKLNTEVSQFLQGISYYGLE